MPKKVRFCVKCQKNIQNSQKNIKITIEKGIKIV